MSKSPSTAAAPRRVTLKTLAEHLGLSVGTISIVLNNAPGAEKLRAETRERVRQAARELGYRPNEVARSLRKQRSRSIGVLMPQIQSHYANGVVAGLEALLLDHDYSYLACSHYSDPQLAERHVRGLTGRQIDGLVLIAAPIHADDSLPTVTVAGRRRSDVVPDIMIDHDHAARQALAHLRALGHERIAFFKGNPESSDSFDRWRAIQSGAEALGIEIASQRVRELVGGASTRSRSPREGYDEGYALGRSLLDDGGDFTALFAFNDLSAIGAMRAFLDAGRRVPEDISVIGFDDIYSSAFQRPSLTTLRQPLEEMGEAAGRWLLHQLDPVEHRQPEVTEAPLKVRAELIVRESTGPVGGR